ncbi:MAG TPA: hypothetical protein VEO91_02360 [Candidatus Limnocylindria bacterium]|nr:hypothetical protein [Candidatus Limnocylindria bacterium]
MLTALRRLRSTSGRTIIVAIAAFALGWVAATTWAAATGSERVHLEGDDGGVVTFVNVDGSKFCFTSDRDGQEQCGAAYKAVAVEVGQRVEVTVARVPLRPDVAKLYWIVTLPPPR